MNEIIKEMKLINTFNSSNASHIYIYLNIYEWDIYMYICLQIYDICIMYYIYTYINTF